MSGATILVLNGPNLNMLGLRQPEIYGSATLANLERLCREAADAAGVAVECRQSNHEGDLIGWIQEARTDFDGLVLNAGAYTHTSVALYDAIVACETPVIEVHVSNIYAREPFRHHSYISPVAAGGVFGMGLQGYAMAIQALARRTA
ncbi:MAG: type II 3-dehydroquinate dehydratase [Alphaproteobacteria bacterium]|nr:type II 3-dehydroquinate dehydratase [Alphaproteobacteria bacterium]